MRRGTHRVSKPYIRSVPICIDIVMLRCQQPRITGYRLNQKELEKVTLQPGVLISGLQATRTAPLCCRSALFTRSNALNTDKNPA